MNKDFSKIEDFICDDSFNSWANKINDHHLAHWDKWMLENPDKAHIAVEAANFLQNILLNEAPVADEQLTAAEERLRVTLNIGREKSTANIIPFKRKKIWYAAAAALIAVMVISLQFLFTDGSQPKLATNYGQILQNTLPDGTDIILNANSKVSYPDKWQKGKDREVWIKGEAFFHVKKTPTHDKFIVHTDAFDIEVTGTSFNVMNRNGLSSIILKEGSVKIHQPGKTEIIMKPGDFVKSSEGGIEKSVMVKQDYLAWTDSKLVFDNTSMQELAGIIQDHYGLEVILKGNGLSQKTITGIMPNNSLDILLQSLEATQDFSIQRSNNALTITNKTNN